MSWAECRFLSASVLPVRAACDLRCPFCFSKASISALRADPIDWRRVDVETFFHFSHERGASRLVITGGGEPLLRPDDVIWLVERGRAVFEEIALFTNGSRLTPRLADALGAAGLSYLCWSRHHHDDERNRAIMGRGAPSLDDVLAAAGELPVRATCVMVRGGVDDRASAWEYVHALASRGVKQLTMKHTYVAYARSVFAGRPTDVWAVKHQVQTDPFAGDGEVVGRLPWGPEIRRVGDLSLCWYYEPTPAWELENQLCRSSNLLSDGKVYCSLEDQRSHVSTLACS